MLSFKRSVCDSSHILRLTNFSIVLSCRTSFGCIDASMKRLHGSLRPLSRPL